jgi:hypothetical protein
LATTKVPAVVAMTTRSIELGRDEVAVHVVLGITLGKDRWRPKVSG